MKIVGYMEGTNSEVMTNLMLEGYETFPLSNGFDNHGKYLAHINRTDNIALVVGYLHKFIPVAKEFSLSDMLSSLKIYRIPVVFIVPEKKQAKARKIIGGKVAKYHLADPGEITDVVLGILKGKKKIKKTAKAKRK